MKKVIKKVLVVVIMFTTVLNHASDLSQSATAKERQLTHVTFKKVIEGSKLTIKDDHGLILYKEYIKESGTYVKDFDLTSLPDGDYYFEIDNPFEVKVIPFKVIATQVTFNKTSKVVIRKPQVTVNGNRVIISRVSPEQKDLRIKVYYEDYDLAYTEEVDNTENLRRVYDFSTSASGNYRIVFETQGRTFMKNIKI